MNISKLRFILWGTSVISLAVVLGTLAWLKLTPRTVYHLGSDNGLEGLNRYGSVPDFSLTERSRRIVRLGDLQGSIWIADFIYTNCTDTCPMQTATMAKLQEELPNQTDYKLVSISVDPERDTPAALTDYAARYKADAKRWWFLTGDKQQITRLVQEGFRLSAMPAGDASAVVLHSSRFVLVDGHAQIRGYYESQDPEALRRLKKDAATLSREK